MKNKTTQRKPEKKVYLYGRSRCYDEFQNGVNRIEIQRTALTRYAIENELRNYEFIFDTGYSGLDYKRPALCQMIQEAKAGNISAVIIHDMTRIGRDILKTIHITNVLYAHGVKRVVINDIINAGRGKDILNPFAKLFDKWCESKQEKGGYL